MEAKTLNFVNNNVVFIHDDFNSSISSEILYKIDDLIDQEKNKKAGKIIIDICSRGGEANYLFALLTRIEKAKKENIIIETRAFAKALSCGSVLACSGTKGYRFIGEFAEHLCHLGSFGFRAENDKELERGSERGKSHFDFVRAIYKKYATIPNLNQVIKDDYLYVRGQKIIDWGLADHFY